MIKLFTLENLSAFSSDAVYKICLALDPYGVSDESICTFKSFDELLENAQKGLVNGDYIIIAAENNEYSSLKRQLASKFMLEESSNPELAETITKLADTTDRSVDFESQCIVPSSCLLHLSSDGLYSGFSFGLYDGVCTMIPLDFSRLDNVLTHYINTVLTSPSYESEEEPEEDAPEYKDSVSKMVYSLIQVDKHIAVATSEASMKIYDLYDKIDGLSQVVNFVELIDAAQTQEINGEETTKSEEEEAASTNFLSDEEEETEEKPQPHEETPSELTVRKAREAKTNLHTDFGAAISDVYESEDEDGSTIYSVYVAVSDENSTKVKRLNTKFENEAELLLPHCVTVLCETVCQKIDAVVLPAVPEEKKKIKLPFNMSYQMLGFAAAMLLVAIITPIILVHTILSSKTPTEPAQVIATGDISTTAPTAPTQNTFPGVTAETDIFGQTKVPAFLDPTAPAEPPATDIKVETTTPNVSSTKGTFTFYVFGYGHGVGMSQYGANYLASQGWNYAQILANYYYGTTLVSGETYPETINYNGTDYNTRDYLAGVLEGEMGGSFNKEALKAQAVAAYTFAKYYGYKLTTDSNAYKPNPSQACYSAVDEVMNSGLYISYAGSTALTPFHAISAGLTTSYYNAWGGTAVPYLAGGRPSYVDYYASDFKSTFTITSDEFKTLVEAKDLGITLSGDPATWISIISHDAVINNDIGYVSSINVGGKIMSGNSFRINVLDGKIRSHCFTVVYTPSEN